jgi:hypothetical protein
LLTCCLPSGLAYIGTAVTTYSINLFAPTIIKQLNPTFSARHVQALVIPIFIASAVSALIIAFASDHLRHRFGFAIIGYAITSIGFIILLCEKHVSVNARYGALYLASIGTYICLPMMWVMLINNVSGKYKTAYALGMEIGLGNAGGIVSSLIFQSKNAPLYTSGYAASLGLTLAAAFLLCGFVIGLFFENKKRAAGKRDYRLDGKDADNLGDDHPHFKFAY